MLDVEMRFLMLRASMPIFEGKYLHHRCIVAKANLKRLIAVIIKVVAALMCASRNMWLLSVVLITVETKNALFI